MGWPRTRCAGLLLLLLLAAASSPRPQHAGGSWLSLVPPGRAPLQAAALATFLHDVLVYDPAQRPTAQQLLAHPFLLEDAAAPLQA